MSWKVSETPLALVESKSSALLDWCAGHTYTGVPGEGDDVLETLFIFTFIFDIHLQSDVETVDLTGTHFVHHQSSLL